jgi:DNA-binding MarR family transcriptional regulator
VSGRIVREVLDFAPEDLNDAQLMVLVALAEDASERSRVATHCSVAVLSHRIRKAPKTVHNALYVLKQRGLIHSLHKAHPGRVQHYRLTSLSEHHRIATGRPKDEGAAS